MSTLAGCSGCGSPLRTGARFCTRCGQGVGEPPDTRPAVAPGRGSRRLLPVLVTALALVASGAVALVVHRSAPDGGSQPPAQANADPPVPSTRSTAPSVTPAAQLRAAADAGRVAADRLIGYWFPEVSAKMPGIDGYDEGAVLTDHRAQSTNHPGTSFLLVRSGDYSTFQRGGYWVTLAATPFATSGEANSWCDANGYGPDDCFAKRLSHSDGPAGNTVNRR